MGNGDVRRCIATSLHDGASAQVQARVQSDHDQPREYLIRLKYRQRAHVAEHLAIAQQYRVSNDVQRHFYMALAAMERVTLQNELLKTAEDGAVTSRELFNQGQANLPAFRKANVELQHQRLEVLNAVNEYRVSSIKSGAVQLAVKVSSQLFLDIVPLLRVTTDCHHHLLELARAHADELIDANAGRHRQLAAADDGID